MVNANVGRVCRQNMFHQQVLLVSARVNQLYVLLITIVILVAPTVGHVRPTRLHQGILLAETRAGGSVEVMESEPATGSIADGSGSAICARPHVGVDIHWCKSP